MPRAGAHMTSAFGASSALATAGAARRMGTLTQFSPCKKSQVLISSPCLRLHKYMNITPLKPGRNAQVLTHDIYVQRFSIVTAYTFRLSVRWQTAFICRHTKFSTIEHLLLDTSCSRLTSSSQERVPTLVA